MLTLLKRKNVNQSLSTNENEQGIMNKAK